MRKAIYLTLLVLLTIQPTIVFAFTPTHLFTDQEKDFESELYYYDARYYDPNLGKFIQPDPVRLNLANPQKLKEQTGQNLEQVLANPQALNSYSYSIDNPVKYLDPQGEWFKDFMTGQQSWPDFQMELGQAAMYTGPLFQKAMDHPYISGAVIGVGTGLSAMSTPMLLRAIPILSTQITQGDQVRKIIDYTSKYGNKIGSKMNQISNTLNNEGYQYYDHAIKRMAERNINVSSALNNLQNIKPFEYLNDGAMKYGYYDSVTKVFVGQLQSTKEIATVINNVTQKYINNLIMTLK